MEAFNQIIEAKFNLQYYNNTKSISDKDPEKCIRPLPIGWSIKGWFKMTNKS